MAALAAEHEILTARVVAVVELASASAVRDLAVGSRQVMASEVCAACGCPA
jgi:hypothetical protein